MIYSTKHFDASLTLLLTSGGKSLIVYKKAFSILRRLQTFGVDKIVFAGKITKYGEHRLSKCFKYDVCNGYRMLCKRGENVITMLFIGTHDECDRWIARHIDDIEAMHGCPFQLPIHDDNTNLEDYHIYRDVEELRGFSYQYEKDLMCKIDNNILQQVFSGFYQEVADSR